MHGLVYSGLASPNHITAALSLILSPSIQSHPNKIQRNMKVKLWFPIPLLVLAFEFNRLCWRGSLEKSTQKSCLSTALPLSLVGTGWRVSGKTWLLVMKPSHWSHEHHLVTASQNSELNFVAIFTILTPQPPVPSVWPLLPSGRWTDDSFLEFATNFFWQFFTGTEIKVSSCTGSSVWAHCAGNGCSVFSWLRLR